MAEGTTDPLDDARKALDVAIMDYGDICRLRGDTGPARTLVRRCLDTYALAVLAEIMWAEGFGAGIETRREGHERLLKVAVALHERLTTRVPRAPA